MGLIVHSHVLLRKTKISDSNMALRVKEHIFWFEVSVNDSLIMQAAQRVNYLSSVDLCSLFAKLLVFPQVSEKFSSVQKVNNEVKFGLSLEGVVQPNDVRIFYLLQNISFSLSFHKQIFLYQLILLQNFHCIWQLSFFVPHKINLSK